MSNFNHSRFLSNWDSEDDHANIAEYRYKYMALVCHNGKVDSDKSACANGLQHVWLGTTRSRNLNRLW
jgi:hypothetical protein